MDKIASQRKTIIGTLVALAIFVHGILIENSTLIDSILPNIGIPDQKIINLTRFLIGSGALYTSIVLIPLWLYDHWLWKIVNPSYDLAGKWEVFLEVIEPLNDRHLTREGQRASEKHISHLSGNKGIAIIRQTPFRLWIPMGTVEEKKTSWRGECLNSSLPENFIVIFEGVDGGKYSGRDSLGIAETDNRGRPIKLIGKTYHITTDTDFVYRGEIIYVRKSFGERGILLSD